MPKYVKLPDNSLFPVEEGEDYATAMRAAYAKYPDAFGEAPTKKGPESGFMPALKAGYENLRGDISALAGKTGITNLDVAEKEVAARRQRAAEIYKPTEDSWSQSPLTKLGELAGGSLPYMAAPLAAGAAALALPETAAATAIGTGLAGLTSAAQFTGSNLGRQMEEGKTLKETELGSAALAAVPQAALDMIGLKMIPGVRQLFAAAGKEVSEQAAKKIAEQGMKQVLKDYGAATVKTMGTEGLTEAGQQVFERLQAGLSITDEKARDEYLQNFVGGAVLGGVLAPGGRYAERSSEANKQALEDAKAKRLAQAAAKAQADADRKAQEAQDEEIKASPAYAMQVGQQYDTLLDQFKTQKAALKKPGADATPVEKAEYKDAQAQLNALNEQLKEIVPEYRRTKAIREQELEKQRVSGMSPEEYMLEKAQEVQTAPAKQAEPDLAGYYEQQIATPPKEENAVQQYVAQRLGLMQQQSPTTDREDYINYLMQDPEMARQVVAERVPLPGLNRKDREAVLNTMGLHIKAFDKQRLAQERAGTAAGAQRIGAVEEEEQAALQAQRAEEARMAQEAEIERQRAAKVAPEMAALQRMRQRPSPITQGMEQFQNQPAPITTSPAIGQMQQELAGIPQAERTLPTAEIAEADKTRDLRRVPGAEFKLRPGAPVAAPVNREEVADRLNYVLSTYDLSPDAVDFLQRVEKALPAKLDPDYATALDAQLAKIESGEEGVPRKGVGRTELLKTFPAETPARAETAAPTEAYKYERQGERRITGAAPGEAQTKGKPVTQPAEEARRSLLAGEAPVEKRVSALTEETLRGPSAKAADLSLQDELVPHLQTAEQAAAENAGQGELFPGEGKELAGVAKEDRAAFERFMNSPYVRKLQKAARENQGTQEAPLEGKAAERAEAGANQARVRDLKQDISDTRTRLWNTFLSGESAATGTKVRALTEAERAAREKGLTSDAAKEIQYANELYNKPLKWLEQELGKVQKKVVETEKAVRAAKKRSGEYVGGEGNVQAFKGLGSAIRTHANASARIESLEDAIAFRQAQDAERMTATKPRTITPDTKNAALLEDAFAVLKNKPAIKGKVSQVSRSTSAAPNTLRTGTATSKAGKTSAPVSRKAVEERKVKEVDEEIRSSEMQAANAEAARIQAMSKREKAKAQREAKALEKAEREMQEAEAELEEALSRKRPLYRTVETKGASTLETQQVENLAKRITEGWVNAPVIKVVANEDSLPVRIRNDMARDEKSGQVPGLYDTKTKTVYLIADALHNANDVVLTVAHEAAGHHGLRELLGGTYTKTMDNIFAGNKAVQTQAKAKMAAEPNLAQQVAVEEVLAEMAEKPNPTPEEKNALQRIYAALKQWFAKTFNRPHVTDAEVQQVVANARQYVIEGAEKAEGQAPAGEVVKRTKEAKYGEENALTDLAGKIIAKPKTFKERMGNNLALEAEMNAVDMRAGLREALKAGAKEMGDDSHFTQAMYNVTKADQKMSVVQAVLSNGPLELYTDDKGYHGIRSSNQHSAKEIFQAISDIPGGNEEGKVALATTYMIAQRAANKGLEKLDLGELGVTQAELDAAMAAAKADPALGKALEHVRTTYNAYNKGLIEFLASTGAIPKSVAQDLLKNGDYVPYYRVNENGMADLTFGGEVTINIGDIRHQPYLNELKGGETRILPLTESVMRNTLLLTDKALTNLATKNVAYAMQAFGEGHGPLDKEGKPTNAMAIHKGTAPAGPDIIKFNQEPDPKDAKDTGERWVRVRTEGTAMEGIPSELVVKSLEGAHLTLPAFLKIGGIAGDILRSGVTRTPIYLARQLVRDPMAASFTGGLNYGPLRAVAKAGKEFIQMTRGKSETGAKLIERGLIQSGIFTGDADDMAKMALQLASGKNQGAIDSLLASADRAAMRADAATRALVYDNAIKNGLSEVEADMMVMESMNFHKRGLSPTVQYASRLIPFFNAQIQGLNVLYKAARGQMPFEEQQRIKQKFFNNAMLLVGTGIAYAMAMEDDEYFRNAKPKDRYSNFFLPLPGVDEPLKLPIPYEAGWFFSLAVAAVDAMKAETDGKQQWQALRDMFLQSVPGYTSKGVPQAVKPVFEVWTNKNFFTGGDLESARLQKLAPQERFTASTTEAAKALSRMLPMLSPIQIEHLATGYFGQLPLVVMGAASSLFKPEATGEAPTARITDIPLLGSSFQKKYGGADSDVMYREAADAVEAKATYDSMRKQGRVEEAKSFLEDNRATIAAAGLARNYQTAMGRLRADQDRITAMPNMSGEEKRARIDRIDAARQDVTNKYTAALKRVQESVDKTTRQ